MSDMLQRGLRRLEGMIRPPDVEGALLAQAAQVDGPVRIVADSGCDLPVEMARDAGVTLVPLVVRFGQEVLADTELSRERFWEYASQTLPQTSQPSIGAFEEAYSRLVGDGAAILCLTITSKHSGTYNAAWAAAQQFPGKVIVFDSLEVSAALGLQVLEAAEAARQGLKMGEIVKRMVETRSRSRLTILLDNVDFLQQGGRMGKAISAVKELVRFLSVRPLLHIVEGQLRLKGPARSYKRGLAQLVEEALKAVPLRRIAIAHTRRAAEALALAQEIARRAAFPPEKVLVLEAGAALGSHAGPGAMGVATVAG
jgi:DegV family protein with EDD domain